MEHREQQETNRQFLGELQVQTERHALALEQFAVRTAAAPPAATPSVLTGMTLHQMDP